MPGQPLDENLRRQMEAVAAERERMARLEAQLGEESRRQVLAWSAIMCSCVPQYDREQPASHAGCMVHGTIMITMKGEVL